MVTTKNNDSSRGGWTQYIALAVTLASMVSGGAFFLYRHGVNIHDNTQRSTRSVAVIERLVTQQKTIDVRLERIQTTQEQHRDDLRDMGSKFDRLYTHMLRLPAPRASVGVSR